jgi:hypothetical protein
MVEDRLGRRLATLGLSLLALVGLLFLRMSAGFAGDAPVAPNYASQEEADAKSSGCLSCHSTTDNRSMHAAKDQAYLSCIDCHGGNPTIRGTGKPGSPEYARAEEKAHVLPQNRGLFRGSANPERSYTELLKEDLAFVRFMNPGDLRAAPITCGGCHEKEVHNVSSSLMTHGAMLYGAALYNNGVLPLKNGIIGESYGPDGRSRRIFMDPAPTSQETRETGVLPELFPFPRWEMGQTGNPFRVFERGGRRRFEIGLPDPAEDPGKPDKGLSFRGPGTLNRTDPLILGAQKTRLVDPMLSLLGTNDHPGDYRSSGCTACHVVYANDRSRLDAGPYAEYGNRGQSRSQDPTIPKGQSGHPLQHTFTNSIPSSQCMTCHMHPGTNMVATYFGTTWWDNEADAQVMYPKVHKSLSAAQRDAVEQSNPDGAAQRGLWSDREFLANVTNLNPQLKTTQFADFHGHGWVFRNVYKRNREGSLLDAQGKVVPESEPAKFQKAVHLVDIHLEKGMQCVDCHFRQDSHGNGKLYGEPRPAVEIDCIDCHGNENSAATLVTSGPASTGTKLLSLKTPFGEARFERAAAGIIQRSVVEKDKKWTILQTSGGSSEKAQKAHGLHSTSRMTCYACHSAWTTSCFGCHLSMRANEKKPNLHSEGTESRNWTGYNFQTLRDDIYFLAKDGYVGPHQKDPEGQPVRNRITPARSACAILVSSQNQNREWIYSQQQTVSAAGFSGTAFSTYVPHTVRTTETRTCTDCHLSKAGDNNAWLASLLMQGTGLTNFIGRYAYVGEASHGFEAVAVTEREEPQAVIGSRLHEIAYPDEYRAHASSGRTLKEGYHHGGNVLSLQLRGEYLFAAQGKDGVRIYDVAEIDHKGFSERVVSAPVSPLGQKLYVHTKDATSVALPSTMTLDPTRRQLPDNQEQPVHPFYDYAFVTDREEGLVIVGPLHTLLDGDPRNNFIGRTKILEKGRLVDAWNPDGALSGATSLTLAGTVGYITTPKALLVADFDKMSSGKPAEPVILARVSEPDLKGPRAVAVQLRYAFVCDTEGLKVLDISDPRKPRLVPKSMIPLKDARNVYLARTYAYVAAGKEGLVIVDIQNPTELRPEAVMRFDGKGSINDASDVKIGMTNGSAFAYLADGVNGLRVIQTISANDTPGAYGFSPRPTPLLIATYKTQGPAIALSRGLDRDRAVDETGNQLSVFGRRGARPLNRDEAQALLKVPAQP